MKERKALIDDAKSAVQAALAEGVVPGGGIARGAPGPLRREDDEETAVDPALDHPGQVDLTAVPVGFMAVKYAPAGPAQVRRGVEVGVQYHRRLMDTARVQARGGCGDAQAEESRQAEAGEKRGSWGHVRNSGGSSHFPHACVPCNPHGSVPARIQALWLRVIDVAVLRSCVLALGP